MKWNLEVHGTFALRVSITEGEVVAVGHYHVVLRVVELYAVLRLPACGERIIIEGTMQSLWPIGRILWHNVESHTPVSRNCCDMKSGWPARH